MNFTQLQLPGVFLIEPQRFEDARGFLAPAWSQSAFAAHGLTVPCVQSNISFSRTRGTLRGLHYQRAPHAQAKLVRCSTGALYDVVLDLRPDSPTYKQWLSVELPAARRCLLYVPEGCAHGFQTLADNTEVVYQVSHAYTPEYAAGVRWNDPTFGITWPISAPIMIARDADYPDFAA
jgi:dTDP-4-dehydrorhamnose 3,5-epimerase